MRGVIQCLGIFSHTSATLGKGNQVLEIWAGVPNLLPPYDPLPLHPVWKKFRMLIEYISGSCHEIPFSKVNF